MRAFVDSEPHRAITTRLDHYCDEATFVDWEQSGPDLPDWQTASRRLVAASHAYAVALRAWGRPEEALEVLDHAHAVTAHLQQGEDT